ncbi:hypothetical protein ACWCQW_53460 [Streptomyces mirabilis]
MTHKHSPLERLHRDGHLTTPVTIHDSWTGKANESLFKPFYTAAREARTELIQAGGEPYKNYKTRLSIALRLRWPKRPSQRSPFWRPDWRMSMVAEASVRHWLNAFKAVQEGHTLVALRNVDAANFWTPPGTYQIGTGFGVEAADGRRPARAALLGHKSLSRTRVYARIADRTVTDEYFAVSEKVEALYDAPRQLPADVEGTEMAKLRREMHRRMLGNGYCARPVEMDCHFESICESCTFFVTTIEFRLTLERRRDDAATKGQVAPEQIFDGLLSRLDGEAS